ncbi:TadE/TadG family type IV pilus assembly protein [Salinispora arenicola]|uniref:TadE/TadG family type IV pilus assembly protein n=1 Tax=Salinispora arenicola TaxID=168697 RepID=UPI0027DC135D|nr:hypothetical protein [Salinispora arenicola]
MFCELLAALRHDDRGEVVPTAIIYAIAAVIALALLTAASDYVLGWIGIWPDAAARPHRDAHPCRAPGPAVTLAQRLADDRGSTNIEMAILFPVFVMLLSSVCRWRWSSMEGRWP